MSDFSSRMIAQVVIEFDTGSEYGGKWTFEDAYADASRAVDNICAGIHKTNPRIKVVRVEGIRSHVIERKS
jgi:hypothetical protein